MFYSRLLVFGPVGLFILVVSCNARKESTESFIFFSSLAQPRKGQDKEKMTKHSR